MAKEVVPQKNMGTYVYCILAGTPEMSFNTKPVMTIGEQPPKGGQAIRLVREGDLTAVVSDAPLAQYRPSRDNVAAHKAVVDQAFEKSEVLPMRFGTVANNEHEVSEFLQTKHDELVETLERVHGRVEMGLRAFWKRDDLFREVLEENEEIRAEHEAMAAGESMDDKIELGRMTFQAIERKREEEGEHILEQIGVAATDVVRNPVRADEMILDASLLVDRSKLQEFDAAVSSLAKEHGGRITFEVLGPFPPYSFTNVVVRDEGN